MREQLYGETFFYGRSETVAASAEIVVPVVMNLLEPDSVIDIGCGKGEWLEVFSRYGVEFFGVDIAAPEASPFMRADLTERLGLGRVFDLALCLEVGEHLPKSAADTLIDTIATHSDQVLFSAAVPGQEGVGHINCQPHSYWHTKFSKRGYTTHDVIRQAIAHPQVSPWYRNNTFLYLRDR